MQMMKDKTSWAQISLIAVLCLAMMALLAPLTARAAEAVKTDKSDCTLSIQHAYDGLPLGGAAFDIYYVASMTAEPELAVAEPFSPYPIPALGMDQEQWQDYAETLAGYIARDGIKPAASKVTDVNGAVRFDGLRTGLYLVIADKAVKGDYTYEVSPFMVSVPSLDESNNAWNYDVISTTKTTRLYTPLIDVTIKKTWNDSGYESARPKAVTFDLFCDGEVYDTVVLNEGNQWTASWEDLDAKRTWSVAEHEVEGYTVKVSRNSGTFVINNSYVVPGGSGEGDNGDGDGGSGGKLPQTGMLWWPVAVLAAAGLGLVLAGVIRRRQA